MSKKLTADDARRSLNAHVAAKGEAPQAKYGPHSGWKELARILEDRASAHPVFMTDLPRAPYLVLHQLVLMNRGAFASADDAETFGANALGIRKDGYYEALCDLADQIDGCAPA